MRVSDSENRATRDEENIIETKDPTHQSHDQCSQDILGRIETLLLDWNTTLKTREESNKVIELYDDGVKSLSTATQFLADSLANSLAQSVKAINDAGSISEQHISASSQVLVKLNDTLTKWTNALSDETKSLATATKSAAGIATSLAETANSITESEKTSQKRSAEYQQILGKVNEILNNWNTLISETPRHGCQSTRRHRHCRPTT